MTKRVSAWVLSSVLCLAHGQTALACAFHGYTPKPTLVDRLLDTEQIVVARLAPSDANRYVAIDTLLGPAVSDISIPVAAAYQTQLSANPAKTVLLARDGAYGPWQELTILDDRFRTIIDAVTRQQSAWLLNGDQARLETFAGLVNDPDPTIRRLALQELDRAPYRTLKATRLPVVKNLGQRLDAGDADLEPIHVLLAGLSQDTAFIPRIADGLDKAVRDRSPFSGAYATALIELSGKAGVAHIRDVYLQRNDLPPVTQERLLQALAIQYRSANAPMRQYITQEVAVLSRTLPGFRDIAARQFGFETK